MYSVTLDVSSLYTNIPHKEGVEACRYILDKYEHQGKLSNDNICKLIELLLHNSYFKFDNDTYLQKMGTAMGSPMAPCFASLFMGKLEDCFLTIVKINRMFGSDFWTICFYYGHIL